MSTLDSEKIFAKKIVAKLDDLDVSSDISARLEFARNQALARRHATVITQSNGTAAIAKTSYTNWVFMALLAISLLAYTALISSEDYTDYSLWQVWSDVESNYLNEIDFEKQ